MPRVRHRPRFRGTYPLVVLICLLVVGVLVFRSCSTSVPDSGSEPPTTRIDPPAGQVWAHYVPQGLPERSEAAGAQPYGSDFPLDLTSPDAPGEGSVDANLARARAAGVTGMQILQIEGVNSGEDFVEEWLRSAQRDTDGPDPFHIAPCILPKTATGTLAMIEQYVNLARQHPSAARVNDAFVVYVFGARELSVEAWQQVRSELVTRELPVYLVGDLQTEASQHGNSLNRDLVSPYLGTFDAIWLFDDTADKFWPDFVGFLREEDQVFVGGVMPGYNRETPRGGYVDAEGTATFRRQWQRNLDAGIPWVNVVTWNDYVESTDIRAGSDWNLTRQDINAFFSAQLRQQAPPLPNPQSYVTTPKFVLSGEPILAEGLVLNGGDVPVEVSVQIVDGQGNPLAPAVTTSVDGGQADAVRSDPAQGFPLAGGAVAYAEVTMVSEKGEALQKVRSAPIVVYAKDDPKTSTDLTRRSYYSIPARQALPMPVTLSMPASPVAGQPGQPVQAAAKTPSPVRFLEVLQNTRSAGLGFDAASFETAVPMQPKVIVGDQKVSAQPRGFYVARAIDDRGRVAYSAPQFFR